MGKLMLNNINYSGGGSGGGSSSIIIPNPQGTPTETLTSLQIDTDIYGIDSGGNIEYATTEFDTGMKWTDGKTIYGLIVPTWNSISSTEYRYDLWRHNPTALIDYGGTIVTSGLIYFLPYNDGTNYATLRYNVSMGVLQLFSTIGAPGATVYVYFTK